MEDASAAICTAILLFAVGFLLVRKTYKGLQLVTKSEEHDEDLISDVPQVIKKTYKKRNKKPGRHKAMVVKELLASHQRDLDYEDLPVECTTLKKYI